MLIGGNFWMVIDTYVCAAMRKLIHIAFAILKSGKPFDPNYGLA
jgi:hypothetical protein